MRYFPSRNEFSSPMTNNTFFHLVTIISFETTVVIGELWKFDDFQESARIVARKIFDKRAIRRVNETTMDRLLCIGWKRVARDGRR